jgi:hypothetical protein
VTKENLAQAKRECLRFLDRVKLLEIKARDGVDREWDHYWPSKETAAVRRASLDLTRALADLRRAE